MSDPDSLLTLDDLDRRLAVANNRAKSQEGSRFHRRFVLPEGTVQFASRAGNDLIAAALIAIAFGAAIDASFSTWPLGTFVMFAFGAVAAVRNVYRTARQMADDKTEAAVKPSSQPVTE
ncbi:MAG: AtpZ/AtpI family protein [Rhodospirillaceae bacterium]